MLEKIALVTQQKRRMFIRKLYTEGYFPSESIIQSLKFIIIGAIIFEIVNIRPSDFKSRLDTSAKISAP